MKRLNTRAWKGLDILIYSEAPVLADRLAEFISKVAPEQELTIDAFETYFEAHDQAKRSKSHGLVFVVEGSGDAPLVDTARELLIPYESRGLPGAAVMIHNQNGPSIRGALAAQRLENSIDYLSMSEFSDPDRCVSTLSRLWDQYILRLEKRFFPEDVRSVLQNISNYTDQQLQFDARIFEYYKNKINLTWFEAFYLRWIGVMGEVDRVSPNALINLPIRSFAQLDEIRKFEGIDLRAQDETSEISVPVLFGIFLRQLSIEAKNGNIHQYLDQLTNKVTPFSHGLLRTASRTKSEVLYIYESAFGSAAKRTA